MTDHKKSLLFTAFDTLFFRESRPFEAIGGSELASVFPPPPRTVMGAIRHTIGESLGVDWHNMPQPPEKQSELSKKVRKIIGYGAEDLGQLSLDGICLSKAGKRLYPAPLWLLRCTVESVQYTRLAPAAPTKTHLGYVKQPSHPERSSGFRSMDDCWLTQTGLEKVLAGNDPDQHEVLEQRHLFQSQPRIGIARDNKSATVQNGLLYLSNHVRPLDDVAIEADFQGLPEEDILPSQSIIRLGAEGRMASMTVQKYGIFPKAPEPNNSTKGLIITLLSPALFQDAQSNSAWLPSGFTQAKAEDNSSVWIGEINGIKLTIHCAVLGKAQREGGWDMAKNAPHPVSSLIPAGSGYFCTVSTSQDLRQAITALHGLHIGNENELGRGRIACGLWNKKIKESPVQ